MALGTTLHEIFAAQAARSPDRVAVTGGGQELTYRRLDDRAAALAARLRAAGAGPGSLVGLCADRSPELIVGLIGILKAGAAYVPVDPDYPADRIAFMLRDSAVEAIVSVARVRDRLGDAPAPVLLVDETPAAPEAGPATPATPATEDDLAYVIYTSGSTGTPKGVLVEHRNAVRLFAQTAGIAGYRDDDVWTQFHSASFDFSVWEIFGALLHGGRLVIVGSATARSPRELRELLVTERVTVLSQTPSAFARLAALEAGRPAGELALRLVVLGGERLDVKLLEPWLDRYGDDTPALVNMYGITETTVHVTHTRITRAALDEPGVSLIGVPLPEMTIHLLGPDGEPVPDGTPGEMHVGGSGVARGYLNRPELTAERFLDAGPGPGGGRRYRSGDRAVRMPDGGYAYLGRTDDQVKVRGFRIEPAEVEATLAAHPKVASAHVTTADFGDGDVRLLAHLVPRAAGPLTDGELAGLTRELQALAREALPEYMRPSSHRFIDAAPLTANGKADRSAVWRLPYREAQAAPAAPAARTGPQDAVSQIVADVLGRPVTALDDDLFDLGATSLAFVRIITSVNQRFQLKLTGAELDRASIRALAACAEAAAGAATARDHDEEGRVHHDGDR